MNIQNTLNDLIARRERLLNETINRVNTNTVGFVFVRPYNLGLIVEQLPEGVQVSPAMDGKLPTIFTNRMANANLHIVKGITNEPEIKIVSIQQYLNDSLESTENTIKMIQTLQPAI